MAEAVFDREACSVTVADVVARAGISRRTFYEHFVDRDECFRATFEWGVTRVRADMAEAYAGQRRWQDGVRAALAAMLALMDEEPALARLLVVRALGGGPVVLRLRAEALAVLSDFVDRGRLERTAGAEPPAVTAEGVIGAIMSVIHTRLLAQGTSEAEAGPRGGGARGGGAGASRGAAAGGVTLGSVALGGVASGGAAARPRELAPLSELLGQLMSLIVLPYLGSAAARRELTRPAPIPVRSTIDGGEKLADSAGMPLTYRTARVLNAIAERPGASNREVAEQAGIVDQGQISRLLRRLEQLGLIANTSDGTTRGAPNAWLLTTKGQQVEHGARLQAQHQLDPLSS